MSPDDATAVACLGTLLTPLLIALAGFWLGRRR